MRLFDPRRWALALLLLAIFSGPVLANDDDTPAGRVAVKLRAMHKSLGAGAHAQGWRTYLKSSELESQLAKGDAADFQAVSAILARYQSDVPGVEWPHVVAVREAIDAWVEQLTPPSAEQLPEMVDAAKGKFRPLTQDDVDQAKAELLQRSARLSRYLASGGADLEAGWKRFLKWGAMIEELERGDVADIEAHLQVLQESALKYQEDEGGLEEERFVKVREALYEYINVAIFAAQSERLQETYAAQSDQLAELLREYAQEPTDDRSVQIGNILGLFERARQAAPVLAAIRRRYQQPNLLADVSQSLVAAGMENEVDEQIRVRESILGTSIRGIANTKGKITAELTDNDSAAELAIRFTGVADSDNVGQNRSVTIYTTGRTTIDARMPVYIDETGLHAGSPNAKCKTKTHIDSLCAPSRLVTKIAWKRAGKSKGQAEHIASRRAERRVEERVADQADELLQEAQQNYLEKFRNPLVRRGAFPRKLHFRTSHNRLLVSMLQAGASRLGAPGAAPAPIEGADVCVRAHESVVGNFSEAYLSDRTLTDEELVEIIEDLKGEVPEEFKITPDKPPWSITFASTRPVAAVFDDAGFSIGIRGSRFTRGDQVFNEAIEISARYTIEQTDAGAKLTRAGEISVLYDKEKADPPVRLSVSETGFKGALRKKFAGVFKPEIDTDGIDLAGRWEKAGKLVLQDVKTGGGWLTIAWNLAAGADRTADSSSANPQTGELAVVQPAP